MNTSCYVRQPIFRPTITPYVLYHILQGVTIHGMTVAGLRQFRFVQTDYKRVQRRVQNDILFSF